MSAPWPATSYDRWADTCDTLHAHTQLLGKLAVRLAPPEPELHHAALRLTARGWETSPLPAPNGTGALVVVLNLHTHEAVVEHSAGHNERIPLTPHRSVGAVARDVLGAVRRIAGAVEINPTPQEVPWQVPLVEDDEHAHYDPDAVAHYVTAATQAALVLAEFRAPFRGRSWSVAAWWGGFDLGVALFSGRPVDPPSGDYIRRHSADAQAVEVGWWPGDARYPKAAFYGYAIPLPEGLAAAAVPPEGARWDDGMGEFLLDWDVLRSAPDPHAQALHFARAVFRHASALGGWDEVLADSVDGQSPLRRN
jgi:Family of unknown function (DUF5996)